MDFHLYNTLKQSKEKLVTQEDKHVKIYLCGPTVYDFLHIGNFRGPITFNLLRNWLEHIGNKVTFVYNYTDVDDKIIKRAIKEGVEPTEISEKYITEFEKDFTRLGLKKHEYNPKVTDYMDEIITFVEDLIENKKAYEVEGEVFYSIDEFKSYGALSKKRLDENQAGNRVEVDKRKKNPADFVLWKPSKQNEPSWDSPWGKGRPGWHIECSAMIQAIFKKKTIDIHAGGIDLIFPHHENEIAQGEGRTGDCYCSYWMHNNFINMNDEKMSKSLGNIMTARSFMDKYHPEILKYLFLSVHYRSMLAVSNDKILQTISALTRIYKSLALAQSVVGNVEEVDKASPDFEVGLADLSQKIENSLNDDLNSAEFISFIFEGVRSFNALGFSNKKWKGVDKANSEAFIKWMKTYGKLSALFEQEPHSILKELQELLITEKEIDKTKVEELVAKRSEARESKDWKLSDQYRDELGEMGIELHDGQDPPWSVKV